MEYNINISLEAPQATQSPIRYVIIDNHTGRIVGSAKTRARALQSASKRDNAYGAVRFSVKAIYA